MKDENVASFKQMRDKLEQDIKKKDFKEKEKQREKAAIDPNTKKINGKFYRKEETCEKESEAKEHASKHRGEGKMTHLERTKDGWIVYTLKP